MRDPRVELGCVAPLELGVIHCFASALRQSRMMEVPVSPGLSSLPYTFGASLLLRLRPASHGVLNYTWAIPSTYVVHLIQGYRRSI